MQKQGLEARYLLEEAWEMWVQEFGVDGGTLGELITITDAFSCVDSTWQGNPYLREARPWERHLAK